MYKFEGTFSWNYPGFTHQTTLMFEIVWNIKMGMFFAKLPSHWWKVSDPISKRQSRQSEVILLIENIHFTKTCINLRVHSVVIILDLPFTHQTTLLFEILKRECFPQNFHLGEKFQIPLSKRQSSWTVKGLSCWNLEILKKTCPTRFRASFHWFEFAFIRTKLPRLPFRNGNCVLQGLAALWVVGLLVLSI